MENTDCLDLLYRFQTLIVGGLAFTGVVVALAGNAWLARKERRKIREHDKSVLRAALLAELKIIQSALNDNIKKMDIPKMDVLVTIATMSHVYDAHISKIGLLTTDEIESVIFFHMTHKQFRENLILIHGATVYDKNRILIPRSSLNHLKKTIQNLLLDLDQAISAISRHPI